MAAVPLTPDQLQSIISGLRDQPDLMKIFKETLGLEAKVKDKEFHSKTFSRMDKFSGDEDSGRSGCSTW